jgi:hypothetical protein
VSTTAPSRVAPSNTAVQPFTLVEPIEQAVDGVAARAGRWLGLFLRMFTFVLGATTLLAVVAAIRSIGALGEGTYTDTVLLTAALRVRDGLPLYPDVTKSPFLFLHYGPVYPMFVGLTSKVANLNMFDTLIVARAMVSLAALGAAASIAGLSRLCGASRGGALVAAGLFLTSYVIHPWAYVARSDLPAAMFVLSGTFVLLRWPTRNGAVLAGLLLAAGFECKQTYGVGVVAATLSLLWQRQWTRAVLLPLVWGAAIGGIALVMTWTSDGRFLEQTIGNNVIPFSPPILMRYLAFYVPQSAALLLLAGIGLWGALKWKVGPSIMTIRLYALLAGGAGLVSVTRMGANYNYLLEATALIVVFSGVGFTRLWRIVGSAQVDGRGWGRAGTVAAAVVGGVILSVSSLPALTMWIQANNIPDLSSLIEAIREQPGPVLTERDSLAVMLAGKEPIAGDPIGVTSISLGGRWNPSLLNDMVRAHAFSLIVLDKPVELGADYNGFPWWPDGTIEAIQQSYTFERRLGRYFLYVPSTSAGTGSAPAQAGEWGL